MPGFFGSPVLPTYEGPSPEEVIDNIQRGQQVGFEQQREHAIDLQAGRDYDTTGLGGGVIGSAVRNLFGSQRPPSATAAPPTSAAAGDTSLPADAATSTPPALPAGRTAAAAGAASPGLYGTPQGRPQGDGFTPAAAPPVTPNTALTRRPLAGEFVPQFGGNFATVNDGQNYDAAVAHGAAPVGAGLYATQARQQPPPVSQIPTTPGVPRMPTVTVTGSRPPQQPPAGVPPTTGAPPAPTGGAPPAQPPVAPGAGLLQNAAAQQAGLLNQAMVTPEMAASSVPNVRQYLLANGVQPTVSRGGITVDRTVPMLPNAYEATARAMAIPLEQNAQTYRAGATNAVDLAKAGTEAATQLETERERGTTETAIAATRLAAEREEREMEWQKWGAAFGLRQQEMQTKGVQDVIKGAQTDEDRVTGLDQAAKMLQLAQTNPSLMDGANVRAYMQASGIDSSRISGALQELSDAAINPSLKGQITNWLSGKGSGVNDPKIAAQAIAGLQQARVQAFQMYDQKLRAGVLAHGEVQNGNTVVASREAMLAPDLYGASQGGTTAPAPAAAGKGAPKYSPNNPFAPKQ